MKNKIQGCLAGVMIGDAMGMPVELMTAKDIVLQTDGKGISGFIHPIQRKIKGTESLAAGATTDDWQLTEAILKSILRRKTFDLMDISLAHVEAYEQSTFGWGGTTRNGMEQLKKYFDSRGLEGRSPFLASELLEGVNRSGGPAPRGMGNGVAMKIAPVALYSVLARKTVNSDQFIRMVDNTIAFEIPELAERVAMVGRLTHADPRAWAAAYAVAIVISESLLFSLLPPWDKFLNRLIRKVEHFESKYCGSAKDSFSSRLKKLEDKKLLLTDKVETLREEVGVGCIALESVCFAIAVFLRNSFDFRAGILEAVNSGGDADTIASMAGAMIGTVVGFNQIPIEWREYSIDFNKAVSMGTELVQAIR